MCNLKILNFIDNICSLLPKRLHGYNCNRNQFDVHKLRDKEGLKFEIIP